MGKGTEDIGNQASKTTRLTNWSRRRTAPPRRQAGPECGRGPEGTGQQTDGAVWTTSPSMPRGYDPAPAAA